MGILEWEVFDFLKNCAKKAVVNNMGVPKKEISEIKRQRNVKEKIPAMIKRRKYSEKGIPTMKKVMKKSSRV